MRALKITVTALTMVLIIATAGLAELTEEGDAYNSYALLKKAGGESTENRIELLEKALEQSPNFPATYFSLARNSFPDVFKSVDYFILGLKAYARNFWWSFSMGGLMYVSAVTAFMLVFLVLGMISFFQNLPLLVHEISEDKKNLILPLLVIGVSLISPLFFIAGLLMLAGLHMKKSRKGAAYLAIVFVIISPVVIRAGNIFFSAPTPEMRAIVSVNGGMDNRFAIKHLEDKEDVASRFSYALALRREGRLTEAIKEYKAILEKFPDERTYTNLGNAYIASGNSTLAKEEYKKALDLETSPTLLYNMSQAYRDSLDFEAGDRYYDEAAKLDRDLISLYTTAAGNKEGLFVVDRVLSNAELWKIAAERPKELLSVSLLSPLLTGGVGIVLLVLFIAFNRASSKRAFRCSDCGRVICGRCTLTERYGLRCEECHRLFTDDKSPRSRVRRMLAADERRGRKMSVAKALSFTLPGIAQAYAGRTLSGFVLMWLAVFCILTVVLNPLFSTGMAGFSHRWLVIPMVVLFVITYMLSVSHVSRKVVR